MASAFDDYLQEALLRLRMLPPETAKHPIAAVTASAHDGNAPADAVDGDLATRWSASGDGQWLQVDLGAPRAVSKVTVAQGSGDARTARFDVQTSGDGVTWTTVVRTVASGTTLKPETYDVPDTTARYVRFVGHGATGTTTNAVSEFAVH